MDTSTKSAHIRVDAHTQSPHGWNLETGDNLPLFLGRLTPDPLSLSKKEDFKIGDPAFRSQYCRGFIVQNTYSNIYETGIFMYFQLDIYFQQHIDRIRPS